MSKRSVGIDIGSFSIKVAELSQNSKGFQVLRGEEILIGQNPGFDPTLEIIETLKTLKAKYNLGAQAKTVFALSQNRVSSRFKVFPFKDKSKVLKSLPIELEEDLPFDSENAIFDARFIVHKGNTTELLASAVLKDRVQDAVTLLQSAGVEASVLSTEGNALANFYENSIEAIREKPEMVLLEEAPSRELIARLTIGHKRSLLQTFEDDRLVEVRTLLWGGSNLADLLVKKFGITYPEAIKELNTKAFVLLNKTGAAYDQINFSDTLSSGLKELSRELQVSLLQLQSELNGEVRSLELSGGVSELINLNAFLTQELNLPVNKAVPSAMVSVTQETLNSVKLNSMGLAIGLAIEGFKKPKNPATQFLKGEFASDNKKVENLITEWGVSAAYMALLFLLVLGYSVVRNDLTTKLDDRAYVQIEEQAKEIARLPNKSANENGVQKYVRDVKKKATEIKKAEKIYLVNSALEVVKKLSESLPARSSLTFEVQKLDVTDSKVVVQGSVASPAGLNQIAAGLKTIALGQNVKPIQAQGVTTAPGETAFAFEFDVDRGLIK